MVVRYDGVLQASYRLVYGHFAARRSAKQSIVNAAQSSWSTCWAAGCSGVVLFDRDYILYPAGFAFIPTERPIAFVIESQG